MAEQKQKSFGIILKDSKTKKQKEERKLYTIVSCCVSAIFLITIFVPFLTNGEAKASGNSYKSMAIDLADLEVDDEAERALLEMDKYKDIPQQKVFGGLFTKKQKEERQEIDKKQGLPPAADKEYLQARKTKKKKQTRGVQRTPTYTQRNNSKTPTGNMAKSGMVSVSGGSSGVSGSIWTSKDKPGQNGTNGYKNGNAGNLGTQQLVASANTPGRRISSLTRAYEESQRGADSKNADVAGQAMVDAFTDNNIEAEDDGLVDATEELAEKFNPEELKKLANDKDLTDLKNDLNAAKDDEIAKSDPCADMKNKMSFACFWGPALLDIVKSCATAAINYGFSHIGGGSSGAGS